MVSLRYLLNIGVELRNIIFGAVPAQVVATVFQGFEFRTTIADFLVEFLE
jgi:hypothetical protein